MKTKKKVLKPEDAAAVKRAAKVIARLNKKARAWSDKIDAMPNTRKNEWADEIAKFHEWAGAVEKETGTVLAACEFMFA